MKTIIKDGLTGVLLAFALPLAVAAQGPNPCGDTNPVQEEFDYVESFFKDAEWASTRSGLGISTVGAGETSIVVTVNKDCRPVKRDLDNNLESTAWWGALEANGFTYTIYQFGDYYAVHVRENRSTLPHMQDSFRPHSTSIKIWRISDGEFLGSIMP